MPRTARASVGGICYHVINRGNGRARVFHDDRDYRGFMTLMSAACQRLPMRVLGYCLMPNHFHLVLWPLNDGDLSRWMQWLLTAQVRRQHVRYGTDGHVWQGRFKAFPIEQDGHLLIVLRYVERNPLRANLVSRADSWPWSSLGSSLGSRAGAARASLLHAGPVARPDGWRDWVQQPISEAELAALRRSVNRGTPWGSAAWAERTASELGLEATLRPRGRPRKQKRGHSTLLVK